MAEKKHSFKKSFLIFLLVMTPPFWLLFTDEGSRVSDTALLWLLGRDEIKLDFAELDGGFSRADIETVYADTAWKCGAKTTTFGDELCAAGIGTFNGFPAQLLTFYFQRGQVSAVKLIYRGMYHEQILGHYIGQLGQPDNVAAAVAEGPKADEVLQWDLGRGMLLLQKAITTSAEPSLLWLAKAPTT
ncbi:MAG: hypothetical protein KDI88_05400 [Gammaproteobacteria bacterium]|nr:hypothetical protein [Gammaproteobacteria bacterium]